MSIHNVPRDIIIEIILFLDDISLLAVQCTAKIFHFKGNVAIDARITVATKNMRAYHSAKSWKSLPCDIIWHFANIGNMEFMKKSIPLGGLGASSALRGAAAGGHNRLIHFIHAEGKELTKGMFEEALKAATKYEEYATATLLRKMINESKWCKHIVSKSLDIKCHDLIRPSKGTGDYCELHTIKTRYFDNILDRYYS